MQTEAAKIIATGTYQNGAFGTNHVSIARKSGGYVVRDHYADGFWIASAVEAKAAFRDLIGRHDTTVTLRGWA